jgi:pimeloyl-ACP methyl ester carboxylesterase
MCTVHVKLAAAERIALKPPSWQGNYRRPSAISVSISAYRLSAIHSALQASHPLFSILCAETSVSTHKRAAPRRPQQSQNYKVTSALKLINFFSLFSAPFFQEAISLKTQRILVSAKMTEKTKPTIVFVPGLWEGPTVFTSISTTLQALGYPTVTATLPSTGTSSPGNPSMRDDEQAIRYIVKHLVVDEEKTVVLVCHSAGGFLGSGAIEGLNAKNLRGKGGKGGVAKIVFLAAGVVAEGFVHEKLPFMDFVVS